jgi:glycosyltransferase involved in cell wall biosynthesis
MCTYNGARFLREQLDSVVAQSRPADEVVICDDISSDGTPELLTTFATSSPVPVIVHRNASRLGSTKNFEKAIDLCTGDIIVLCDQDDIWLPEKLEVIESLLKEKADVGLVFSDAELVDESGQSLNRKLFDALQIDSEIRSRMRNQAYKMLDRFELLTGATMAFRSKFKSLVLPIPTHLPLIHDGWIALMISHAAGLEMVDKPLIKYRQHSSQQIGVPLRPVDSRSSIEKVVERAKEETDFDRELNKIQVVLARMKEHDHEFEYRGTENLNALLQHFQIRKAIPGSKLKSLPGMLSELLAGNYHRYSRGVYSFAKDLLK